MVINYRLFIYLIWFIPSFSEAQIFKVTNPQTGHVTLTNIPPREFRETTQKNETLDAQPPKNIAVPKQASKQNFPKISAAVQAERDNDRKTILETELVSEKKLLAIAEKTGDQEVIHRHIENLKALEREIKR